MNTNYYLMIKWKGGCLRKGEREKKSIHVEVLSPYSTMEALLLKKFLWVGHRFASLPSKVKRAFSPRGPLLLCQRDCGSAKRKLGGL